MNQKIRLAQMQKNPYMLIVGDKEKELGGVAVRLRSGEDLGIIKISDLVARIKSEIGNRAHMMSMFFSSSSTYFQMHTCSS